MKLLGYNDEHDATLKGFLLPTLSEVTWLLVISFLLMIVLNHQGIWDLVISDSGTNAQAAQPLLESVSMFFAQATFGKMAVFVFWAFVGCISYAIIWTLQHFATRVKDDVQGSEYVNPDAGQGYWSSRFSSYAFLVSITFIFVVTVIICATTLIPYASRLASIPLEDLGKVSNYKNTVFALLITMACLYVLSRIWQAVKYSFKLNFGSA